MEQPKDGKIKGWFTAHGKHIPIMEGETKADAIKRIVDKNEDVKKEQINRNRKEAEKLNKKPMVRKIATHKTQAEHTNAIKDLDQASYSDGTYDIDNKKKLEFDDGYQVTFCQIGDDYSDNDYSKKVNECLKMSSNGRTYAGKFGGTPEISFHCKNREQAIAYARANNQVSIFDWAEYQKDHDSPFAFISTGGTGKRKN